MRVLSEDARRWRADSKRVGTGVEVDRKQKQSRSQTETRKK